MDSETLPAEKRVCKMCGCSVVGCENSHIHCGKYVHDSDSFCFAAMRGRIAELEQQLADAARNYFALKTAPEPLSVPLQLLEDADAGGYLYHNGACTYRSQANGECDCGYQDWRDLWLAITPRDTERLNWLANTVLACDFGDNSHPDKKIGWRVMEFLAPVMYGASIAEAIDSAMAQEKSKSRTPTKRVVQGDDNG